VERAAALTADAVTREARLLFSPGDFSAAAPEANAERLAAKLSHLSLTPEGAGARLWSASGDPLFPPNAEGVDRAALARALGGEVATLRTKAAGGAKLLTLYVPVRLSPGSAVVGAVETSIDLTPLLNDIRRQRSLLWSVNLLGVAALFLTLYGLVARASRTIGEQNERLKRSESRLRNLLLFAHDAIVTVDGRGKIVLFNRAAEQLFGLPGEEAKGKAFDRLVSPADRLDIQTLLERLRASTGEDRGVSLRTNLLVVEGIEVNASLSASASGTGEERVVTFFIRDDVTM